MRKIKKPVLVLVLSLVLVVAVGLVVLLWLWLMPKETGLYLQNVSDYDGREYSVLVVVDPNAPEGTQNSQPQRPFSYYPVSAPDGFDLLFSSFSTENRYASSYSDRFFGEKKNLWVRQNYAYRNQEIMIRTNAPFQEVEFGHRTVFYYTDDAVSGAIWLVGDHLLEVEVQGRMEMDDLLAWVTAVDDSDPQIPPAKPLDFLPAECVPLETESGKEWFFHGWSVTGNPESSDSQQKTVFAQTPTGFTQRSSNDQGTTEQCEFQNQAGDILILENCRIGLDSNTSIFSPISFDLEALQNSDLVKTVEVQGKDGRLYAASDYCELVWLENDYYVRLIYEGSVTVEQMLLWAESTVVQLE